MPALWLFNLRRCLLGVESSTKAIFMKTTDLMERVQFVVDPQGRQTNVLLSFEDWEQVLTLLEDLEDAEEVRRARESDDEEEIPWESSIHLQSNLKGCGIPL
jgi:hypothetical protein